MRKPEMKVQKRLAMMLLMHLMMLLQPVQFKHFHTVLMASIIQQVSTTNTRRSRVRTITMQIVLLFQQQPKEQHLRARLMASPLQQASPSPWTQRAHTLRPFQQIHGLRRAKTLGRSFQMAVQRPVQLLQCRQAAHQRMPTSHACKLQGLDLLVLGQSFPGGAKPKREPGAVRQLCVRRQGLPVLNASLLVSDATSMMQMLRTAGRRRRI
mmetsp:Transcript_10060/g.22152  ORF Transcript_10060/g.22152 Transcript_10060/m.22152 type:complete len:210 (+) Transcript_10060:130-759(+)